MERYVYGTPEAKPLEDELEHICQRARKRMEESLDPCIRGLRPTEFDWMTSEEMERVHELQMQLRMPSPAECRERVRQKRAARLRSQYVTLKAKKDETKK